MKVEAIAWGENIVSLELLGKVYCSAVQLIAGRKEGKQHRGFSSL